MTTPASTLDTTPVKRRGRPPKVSRPSAPESTAICDPWIDKARHHPTHCLATGLFRSLQKGDREAKKLDVRYESGDGSTVVTFKGHEPLGVDDMRILQGLIAMITSKNIGRRIPHDTTNPVGICLRNTLELQGDACDSSAVGGLITSYEDLLESVGYRNAHGGGAFRMVQASIERMFTVSVFVIKKIRLENGRTMERREGYRLISFYSSKENGRSAEITFALNPGIADAVLNPNGQFTFLDLAEVRQLKSDPARLLHQHLCGFIDQGKSRVVGIGRLCEYVYAQGGEQLSAPGRAYRTGRIKAAMEELRGIGWSVAEGEGGLWTIGRPAAKFGKARQQDALSDI